MGGDSRLRAAVGTPAEDVEFRRLRLHVTGVIAEHVDYKAQVEFAGTGEELRDAYLGFRNVVPLGYLKVGHFKEPFSLEELTSSNYITFMERAAPVGAFSPSRNIGIQLSNHHLDDRLTWGIGAFREVDNEIRGLSGSGCNVTGRLTCLPWWEDDGAKILHVGVAVSRRDIGSSGGTARYSSRPAIHLAPKFVDTGRIPAERALLFGAEAAFVHGPFSLQAEWMRSQVDLAGRSGHEDFRGCYIEASYWLTGEHRAYKRPSGTFSRVTPKRGVDGRGLGAWQIALRYDRLDLNNGATRGGGLGQWTAGVNWHPTRHTRLMINYANARRAGAGRADLIGVRAQTDF
jgi:phosphate-selective porin OprO/OprP